MFDLVSTNPLIQSMDRSMTLATRRAELIASNMANIDTPGYRTQDFDFHQALKTELTRLDGGSMGLARTHAGHMGPTSSSSLPPSQDPLTPSYERNDGNDVSLDREAALLARTQQTYQLSSQIAQTELRKIISLLKAQ